MNSEEAIFELNNFKYFDMSAWGKLYNKKLFENIRFPEGKLSEDYHIMYLLFDKAKQIIYNSNPLYYYLQRKGSISKEKKINFDFVEAAYNQWMYVKEKYPNLNECTRAAYVSANMTVYNVLLKSKGKCDKNTLKTIQGKVKENLKYVLEYNEWGILKKIQTYLFANCIQIYNITFKVFRMIKKV